MCDWGLNLNKANGLSHSYHFDEFTFIYRDLMSIFFILFHFSMKFMYANRIAPDGTPRFGYSVCLCPIKMTTSLYGLNNILDHID